MPSLLCIIVHFFISYKQQKFNLFREESEGFSKLIHSLDSFSPIASSAAKEEAGPSVLELVGKLQALIGKLVYI